MRSPETRSQHVFLEGKTRQVANVNKLSRAAKVILVDELASCSTLRIDIPAHAVLVLDQCPFSVRKDGRRLQGDGEVAC